ncbi:MAG: 30S ribosomal protein S4 [Chloroflexota bacterium]|nr:MAG: 30S ribosomal protein S4 [Chloroflexota bacterium]
MARYSGPVCRLCRRAGEKLMLKGERCSGPKCGVERHGAPPGQTAGRGRRRKVSERGLQLREKQKARHMYGVLERQFRKHFAVAGSRPGVTGENLLQILEMRLDNVVYRLGLADSRAQARQLVNHGHIALNGRVTNIPSCIVRVGDIVSVAELARKNGYFEGYEEELQRRDIPGWLVMDPQKMSGRVVAAPARTDIDSRLNEQAIVEYYSR